MINERYQIEYVLLKMLRALSTFKSFTEDWDYS